MSGAIQLMLFGLMEFVGGLVIGGAIVAAYTNKKHALPKGTA